MEQPKIFSLNDYIAQISRLIPKYSLTKGLTNQIFRKAVKQALDKYTFEEEFYPKEFAEKYGLIEEKKAIETIHFPNNMESLAAARKRLVFDEFFSFLFGLRQNRKYNEGLKNEYQMFETADTVRLLEQLPFPPDQSAKKGVKSVSDFLFSLSATYLKILTGKHKFLCFPASITEINFRLHRLHHPRRFFKASMPSAVTASLFAF